MDDLTRSTLLCRLKDRADTGAWETFGALYRPLILSYARSRGLSESDAEDVAQQCTQAVLEKIGEYQHLGSFKAWLRAIANHKVVDKHRAGQHEVHAGTGFWGGHAVDEPDASDSWDRQWAHAHIAYCAQRARATVNDSTYEAFEACVVRGLRPADVAASLNISVNQVYVAKHRVLERIRELLRELHGDEVVL